MKVKNIEEHIDWAVSHARVCDSEEVLKEYARQKDIAKNSSVLWGGEAWVVVGVLARDGKYYRVHVTGNDHYDGNKRDILLSAIEKRFHPHTIFCVYYK